MKIETIELSPNSRAFCHNCKKQIEKGQIRGIENYDFFNFLSRRYYCEKCTKKSIETEMARITSLYRRFNKLKRSIK